MTINWVGMEERVDLSKAVEGKVNIIKTGTKLWLFE